MKKISLAILIGGVILAISGIATAGITIPAKKPATVPVDQIERGVFVDYGYDSPPWYPQNCSTTTYETDTYRWAPKISWASLPVDVTIYTGSAPISGTFEAIKDGFTTWDDETGTTLYGSISENTTSGPGVSLNGENTVQWGTIDGPGGIIGVTYYWYYSATKQMMEFDMVLDASESWSTSTTGVLDAFDVQNVATHEVGHTLVLGDIRSPKSCGLTMHAFTWWGDIIKRDLAPGDILGVKAIYGE